MARFSTWSFGGKKLNGNGNSSGPGKTQLIAGQKPKDACKLLLQHSINCKYFPQLHTHRKLFKAYLEVFATGECAFWPTRGEASGRAPGETPDERLSQGPLDTCALNRGNESGIARSEDSAVAWWFGNNQERAPDFRKTWRGMLCVGVCVREQRCRHILSIASHFQSLMINQTSAGSKRSLTH